MTLRRTHIWLLVLGCLFVAGGIVLGVLDKEQTDEPTIETHTQTSLSEAYTLEEKSLTQTKDTHEIAVTYPQLRGDGGAVERRINRAIAERIDELITQFRSDIATADASADMQHSYTIVYEYEHTQNTISILLTGTQYMAGAAHPNTFAESLVFDVSDGTRITIDTLIAEDAFSSFATTVERLAREQYPDMEADWWDDGFAPQRKHFNTFTLKESQMTIYFAPYQIAPYAAGIIDVAIPYEQITESMTYSPDTI